MSMFCCCVILRNWLWPHRQTLTVNVACVVFVLAYSVFGGFVFLHFEKPYSEYLQRVQQEARTGCVEAVLSGEVMANMSETARQVVQFCIEEFGHDERQVWNLKNAILFGFGIITTLGYGLLEPATINGRIFTVIYGFFGMPITVIMLTNFGRYLQQLELSLRARLCRKRPCPGNSAILSEKGGTDTDSLSSIAATQLSTAYLAAIVVGYLVMGAALIPYLNGKFDFFNGIYYAFLCFTAIEFGELVPQGSNRYLAIVILYIVVGLAISTIALDIGSTYVRKLYYLGKKIRHMANVRIWFGSKNLRVKELIVALGQNIGIEPNIICEIDLDQLVTDAIHVKEGKLNRVPQTHMIVEGIWPPELVPLFIKDGYFPHFVDDELEESVSRSTIDEKKAPSSPLLGTPPFPQGLPPAIAISHYGPMVHGAIRRPRRASSGSSRKGERLTVRFEDVIYTDTDAEDFEASSVQHLAHTTFTDVDQTSGITDFSASE